MMSNEDYIKEVYSKYKEIKTTKNTEEFYNIKFKHKNKKAHILKMVATFTLTIGISVGIVYAATVTYQNIWKEPQSYAIANGEIFQVSQEEKEKSITQEEAIKIGNEILNKFDYNDIKINISNLTKYKFENQLVWELRAPNDISMCIDAITGELIELWSSTQGKDIQNSRSTREEAKQTAIQFYEKYKPDDSQYQLVQLNGNAEDEKDVYIWYAEFQKKYGELLNPYEEIHIAWIPGINELYNFSITRNKYENNPIEISKEKAIEIAKEKDAQIQTEYNIKNIQAEERIEKMNSIIYQLEKGERLPKIDDKNVYYETENRVRHVWVVCIEYEMEDAQLQKANSYFVDATTGEIIGGQEGNYFEFEKYKKV